MDHNHNSAKAARTIRSRRIHYFIFCYTLNLTDNWTLANQSQERSQLPACPVRNTSSARLNPALSLSQGEYNRRLLARRCKIPGAIPDVDPRFQSTADTRLAPAIAKVLDEQKRWETVPNRREPFNLELHNYIAQQAKSNPDDCCLDAAMANWTLCNLYRRVPRN
jgi:hypothetical protein